jgi:hypothetical protein
MGKLFGNDFLKIVEKQMEERHILSESQFAFPAKHSLTLQCLRLTDHVTHIFDNKMYTAAMFLDIQEAYDTVWHPSFLNKLSKLEYSTNLIKLIRSFLSKQKF